jgi:hypothetical protein
MPLTVEQLLRDSAFRPIDMKMAFDPSFPKAFQYSPEFGYVPLTYRGQHDGMDGSCSDYTFTPGKHRKMVNYANRPCRINTYGDSMTMCQQVSDGESWQEILAAHFQEPIRNFGVGGYGVYQAYKRLMKTEMNPKLASEYIILYIWDDDHVRSLDSLRWPRCDAAKEVKHLPPNKPKQIHGYPWPHVRFDLKKGKFVEKAPVCASAKEVRKLADPETFYQTFKDDEIIHIFTLMKGGEAPVGHLEDLAEALNIRVDLRKKRTLVENATLLHKHYGMKASEFILGKLQAWCARNKRKLMVIIGHYWIRLPHYVKTGERIDVDFLANIRKKGMTVLDHLPMSAKVYKEFNGTYEEFQRLYNVEASDVAVFGHYNPQGNHRFAFTVKNDILNWLDPKPPAYR